MSGHVTLVTWAQRPIRSFPPGISSNFPKIQIKLSWKFENLFRHLNARDERYKVELPWMAELCYVYGVVSHRPSASVSRSDVQHLDYSIRSAHVFLRRVVFFSRNQINFKLKYISSDGGQTSQRLWIFNQLPHGWPCKCPNQDQWSSLTPLEHIICIFIFNEFKKKITSINQFLYIFCLKIVITIMQMRSTSEYLHTARMTWN